jgi:regulator of cell morphogenesis and NO signaling
MRSNRKEAPVTVLATRTLGHLVAEAPARAAVLDRLGVDYCCHGQRSLADACAAAGLNAAEVSAELDAVTDAVAVDYPSEPAALADHIEATHHRYLHRELPELDALAVKVAGVHREGHPELVAVGRLVAELGAELEPHMLKEERVLFPAIRALVDGAREFPFGTVRNPIRMMSLEHDHAGKLLVELRAATDGYLVPDDGCASYRSLYERLERLETDTHRHIHLENNVLFPAAIVVEDG